MKVNEAPEKLYFPIDDALETYARKDSDEEIEYRLLNDAFIELEKDMLDSLAFYGRLNRMEIIKGIVEDFKKAMEE